MIINDMTDKKEHRKVQVVIIDTSRTPFHLLLLQTKEERDHVWQNVTGSVDNNETFHQAALRELKEETGISNQALIDLDLSFKFHDRWNRDIHEQVYLCRLHSTPEEIKLSDEHQNYKWISIEKVQINSFGHESNFKSFQNAMGHLNGGRKK
ncbi:MAG: NUDIX domain-containing protein [Bdellovibrionales bacterium]|jgi:dATP pyrophosphohydrolase|nr:NUDIX domain-containing protein [Bdellovibrionales bacterium]